MAPTTSNKGGMGLKAKERAGGWEREGWATSNVEGVGLEGRTGSKQQAVSDGQQAMGRERRGKKQQSSRWQEEQR